MRRSRWEATRSYVGRSQRGNLKGSQQRSYYRAASREYPGRLDVGKDRTGERAFDRGEDAGADDTRMGEAAGKCRSVGDRERLGRGLRIMSCVQGQPWTPRWNRPVRTRMPGWCGTRG